MKNIDPNAHEIDSCYRAGYDKPHYQPSFDCSCGFSCREATWEEAGAEIDRHLVKINDAREQ